MPVVVCAPALGESMAGNQAWSPWPNNGKSQMGEIDSTFTGQIFRTSMTRKELDDWTDANSPDMPSLMVEMFGNHHLLVDHYTEARTLGMDSYLAHVATSYETMMTTILLNKLDRGYHLDEMLRILLRAARSYGRGLEIGDVAQRVGKRCDMELWTSLSIMLSQCIEAIQKQSPGWKKENVSEDFRTNEWQALLKGRLSKATKDMVPVAEYLTDISQLSKMTRNTHALALDGIDGLSCWSTFNQKILQAERDEQAWLQEIDGRIGSPTSRSTKEYIPESRVPCASGPTQSTKNSTKFVFTREAAQANLNKYISGARLAFGNFWGHMQVVGTARYN